MFTAFVAFNQRDYQDAWILEDISVPAFLYILTFVLVSTMITDNKIVVLICVSFIVTMNAVPNLKYLYFYGTYDSVGHFGFIKRMLTLGQVPETGFYSAFYSDFPGMHIFIGSFSLITGFDLNISIKLITSTIFSFFPMLIYSLTNHVFDKNAQKYIVLFSGFPLVMSYVLTGTTFGISLFCLFFYLFFKKNLLEFDERRYAVMLIITAFSLIVSHAVTTLSTIIFMCISIVLIKSASFHRKMLSCTNLIRKYSPFFIVLATLFFTWLIFKANFVYEKLVDYMKQILMGTSKETLIPERFFALPFFERLIIFVIKHIKDFLVITLSFIGFIVLIKQFNKNVHLVKNLYLPLICLLSSIASFIFFQSATNFAEIEYRRFIDYMMPFTPFFVGLFFWDLENRLKKSVKQKFVIVFLLALVFFSLILISLLQVFPYQPIVPRANVLSKDMPESDYIVDFRMVNTNYQIKMIQFAERFSTAGTRVTSDVVTRWQIFGFASETFSTKYIWDRPLEIGTFTGNEQWNILLLHYCGKSGPLNEKIEYRTSEALAILRKALVNNIYDNGESFILSKRGT